MSKTKQKKILKIKDGLNSTGLHTFRETHRNKTFRAKHNVEIKDYISSIIFKNYAILKQGRTERRHKNWTLDPFYIFLCLCNVMEGQGEIDKTVLVSIFSILHFPQINHMTKSWRHEIIILLNWAAPTKAPVIFTPRCQERSLDFCHVISR